MCFQNIQAVVAPSNTATIASRPILTVDDPRLDDKNDPNMQRRRRVLAVCGRLLPMAWHRNQQGSNPADLGQGEYKPMYCWTQVEEDAAQKGLRDSCTAVNGAIMGREGAGMNGPYGFDVSSRTNAGWVPYVPGEWKVPSVGDTYLLRKHVSDATTYHSGVVCHVELSGAKPHWICADGGQTHLTKQAAELVPRKFECQGTGADEVVVLTRYDMLQYPDKRRYLNGWLDISHPSVRFANNAAYDSKGTEQQYLDFKALIKAVRGAVP